MEISLETISSVEKQRGRGSNTLKVTTTNGNELFVPEIERNRHYRIIKDWVEKGNPISPPPPKSKPDDRPTSADLEHKALKIPSDHQTIWRYLSFEQFVSMLSHKSLWFTRGSILKNIDPYEGQLPEPNLKIPPEELLMKMFPGATFRKEEIKRFFESHRMTQEIFRRNILINCWNIFDHESYAMWKVYGKGNNSISVKSSVGALKSSLGDYVDYDVFIGEIDYIDYSKESINESNYMNMFLSKTPFYRTEQELRCLILDDGDISLFSDDEPYFWGGEEVQALSNGTNVPCNLNELIHEIYIGPDAEIWFDAVVESTLSQFGIENCTISRSEIRGKCA